MGSGVKTRRILARTGTKYDAVFMEGGWDQLTPSLRLKPGRLRDVQNFEVAPTGGYARSGGYERFSGQTKPSSATYSLVQVSAYTNVPSTGQTITGATSTATGTIVAVVNTSSAKYMALTQITGSFQSGETVSVGATTIGTMIAQSVTLTTLENAQYLNLSADVYRALIMPIPGSGPVRGVVHCIFSGVDHFYAFRDNAGGTATIMYESSSSGWTVVTFFKEVSFTAGGTATPADGETLTQGGVTATIKRVVLQSGAWSGTAAGRFIITSVAGGNFAAGAATCNGGATITLSAAESDITLSTGGKFVFDRANFAGTLGTRRIYGADGVNRAFEFDGTTFVPITTGYSPDSPKHLMAHQNHLFLSFQTSAVHSGIGAPYRWDAAGGASEIAVGDTITGYRRQPGNQSTATLQITGLESTFILYGTSVSTWSLQNFKEGVGAQHYSLQNLGRTYAMDANGIIDLQAVQAYGNFTQSCLTYAIQTFINDKRSRVAYSSVCRTKSQYRVFFDDGTALYLTILSVPSQTLLGQVDGTRFMGAMQQVFPTAVYSAYTGQLANGDEVMLVGSSSGGHVYELDKGSSFDGANIEAYITFTWDAKKSPRQLKEFTKASLEIQGNFYAAFSFAYSLGYGSSEIPQAASADYASNFGGQANWDSVNWDEFVWDGQTIIPSEVELAGTAENIQVRISSTNDYIYPFTVASMISHYIPRAPLR